MNAAALHTAEILVRFANPAEDGKKPSIRASNGDYYGVKPADFGRFQPGGRYRIEYTERVFKGRTYRDIVKCERQEAQAQSTHQRSTMAAGDATPGEAEFVSRCLAASIASCAVGRAREELTERAKMLRAIYREVFG